MTRPVPDPLSFAQQRLWLLHQLALGSSAYNTTHVWRLTGALDAAALREALNDLIERHEILRTRFVTQNGEPRQIVMPTTRVPLDLEDCGAATDAELRALAQREGEMPFDLHRGPPLRARLLRRAPGEHWLVVVLHHIVTDRWSNGVIARELSALYRARCSASPSPLAPLAIQYSDYALWQREWLQGEALEEQLAYWRTALADLPTLELPTDRARPAQPSYRGDRVSFTMRPDVAAALRALAQRESATLFMTLLAAFYVLLHRYSGQHDIAVGVPIAGRTRPELEELIGFFVNTLVLRGDVSGTPTFRELLARVKARALEAYAHQDLPFEKLVEDLAPRRDVARNPLFQVSFAFQNTPRPHWDLPGIAVERLEDIVSQGVKFDLDFAVIEGEGALRGTVDYAADLFERASIDRMIAQWQVLLAGIAADPDCSVARLPLLDDAARAAVAALGRGPRTAIPDDGVADRFEAQAARAPDRIAITDGAHTLTYAALAARANQLAHRLDALGLAPGARVAVHLERSADLIIALLGVLRAGCVYVPLDAAYPTERLAAMLREAEASAVLTHEGLLARLPPTRARVVCLDREARMLAGQPTAPPRRLRPSETAYIVFTSGSTGTPKGVMIGERALVNYLEWIATEFPLRPEDVVLHKTPTSFDASLEELLYPLQSGASLVIAPPGGHRTVADLVALVERHAVTVLQVVPSLLAALLEHSGLERCRTLRLLLCGAETLPEAVLARAQRVLPHATIVNLYGPTETTISSTFHRCGDDHRGPVPIGRPIANTEVLVLDEHGEPAPLGVPGELWIGGAGVARGYLHDPAADSFRTPARVPATGRMYRTGDRVRMRADGALDFLGRCDEQLKVRGVRIEPGDIEMVLVRHPDVAAAAVDVRNDERGQHLVAWVVARAGAAIDSRALRAFVARRVPETMVPTVYMALRELPLGPNGKLDRRRLRNVDALDLPQVTYAPPRDALEQTLCSIWAEVLRVPRVGLDDDFFDAGGHSMLAVRLFARLDETLHRSLPLSALFAAPTVRALAERYRAAAALAGSPGVFPITATGTRPPVFAVPGIAGDVVGYADLVRALGPDQPFYGLQAFGLDGRGVALNSIEAIARAHLDQLRAVQPRGPYAFIGACFGATVAYEMARQVLDAGDEVALLGLLDPSGREGRRGERRMVTLPRFARRAVDSLLFVRGRLALYRAELRGLPWRERARYAQRKLLGIAGTLANSARAGTVPREIHHQSVLRANTAALERYQRKPLPRPVGVVAIMESEGRRQHTEGRQLERAASVGNQVVHHVLRGHDSGDMLNGHNAALVATHLQALLRTAFAEGAARGSSARHAPLPAA